MFFIRSLVASLFVLVAPFAQAEQMVVRPGIFDVTGVAANDVLNIREFPDASSAKIGALAPFEVGIEVIATLRQGRWGLVNYQDQSGWVSMRFMAPSPYYIAANLPQGLTCTGTEPFWDLSFFGGNTANADWSYMGLMNTATAYNNVWSDSPANRTSSEIGVILRNGQVDVAGVITTEICSDGMSDRSYGFSAKLILANGANRMLVLGCCTISSH